MLISELYQSRFMNILTNFIIGVHGVSGRCRVEKQVSKSSKSTRFLLRPPGRVGSRTALLV